MICYVFGKPGVCEVVPDIRPRMTKALLMSLDEGVCLVSNCLTLWGSFSFSGVIPPLSEREGLWEELKKAGIHRNKFNIFYKRKEMDLFIAEAERSFRKEA